MNRRLVLMMFVLCFLAGMALQGYSAPKTLTVGGSVSPSLAPGTPNGIPPEFGDLVAVDSGYLYFTDEVGTIRRVALTQEGSLDGPVLVIPRK